LTLLQKARILCNKKRLVIILIFIIAIILRLSYVIWYHQHSPTSVYLEKSDELDYVTTSVNIVAGNGFWSSDWGGSIFKALPLYPLFLSIFFICCGINYLIITIIQAIISALTCVIIFLIGEKIFSLKAGFYAALISAFCPYFIYFSSQIMTETLTIFILSIVILVLLKYRGQPTFKNALLAGLTLGIAGEIRAEIYFLLFFLFIWFLITNKSIKRAILHCIITILFFIIIVSPWNAYHSIKQQRLIIFHPALYASKAKLLLSKAEQEKFIWPPGGYKIYLKQLTSRQQIQTYEPTLKDKLLNFFRRSAFEHWKSIQEMYIQKSHPIISYFFDFPLYLLFLLGISIGLKFYAKETLLFLIVIISWTLPHFLTGISMFRYSFPVLPYIYIFSSNSIEWIYNRLRLRIIKK